MTDIAMKMARLVGALLVTLAFEPAIAQPSIVRAPLPPAPASQEAVVALLRIFAAQYPQATHDLKRTALRKQRAEALCAKLKDVAEGGDIYSFRGWRGRLAAIIGPSFNTYAIKIQLGQPVMLYASINKNSEMLEKLVNIPANSVVHVDGTFKPSANDCVDEASVTEKGMMEEPELRFVASRIDPQK